MKLDLSCTNISPFGSFFASVRNRIVNDADFIFDFVSRVRILLNIFTVTGEWKRHGSSSSLDQISDKIKRKISSQDRIGHLLSFET